VKSALEGVRPSLELEKNVPRRMSLNIEKNILKSVRSSLEKNISGGLCPRHQDSDQREET